MSEERFDRLENMVATLITMVGATNAIALSTNEQLMSLNTRLDQFIHKQEQTNARLEKSSERFEEVDKRLDNVEHGTYQVSYVERAQNKVVVELSLIKDKQPAATSQQEAEKVSS